MPEMLRIFYGFRPSMLFNTPLRLPKRSPRRIIHPLNSVYWALVLGPLLAVVLALGLVLVLVLELLLVRALVLALVLALALFTFVANYELLFTTYYLPVTTYCQLFTIAIYYLLFTDTGAGTSTLTSMRTSAVTYWYWHQR